MQLQTLFEKIEYKGSLPNGTATSVVVDSRKVKQGSIFVCSKGLKTDSHLYAEKALQNGAVLIVTERPLGLPNEVTVQNGRETYALLSAAFYGYPAEKLHIIAVTGTNGKTTVTGITKFLLEEAGYKVGLIGTMYNQIDKMEIPAKYTTPEAGDLHALFARMVEAGCTHVVMEASSQALAQKRLFGVPIQTGVFTNLTRDHLDYHGTMEDYYLAKKELFAQCKEAIVNLDDAYGKRLAEELAIPCTTFSETDDEADYTARNLTLKSEGIQFEFVGKGFIKRVKFAMPGTYSCQNAMASLLAASTTGANIVNLCDALAQSPGVRGRSEVLYHAEYTVIRDFAHTADGIENLLASFRPFVENRLIVLFGCAGDRDATKRPDMAAAVCKYADIIYFSADNPRGEDFTKTVQDVVDILQNSGIPYHIEEDRKKAVQQALATLQSGDTLLLCGKGHEDYQVLKEQTIYLNEKQIVDEWFTAKEA